MRPFQDMAPQLFNLYASAICRSKITRCKNNNSPLFDKYFTFQTHLKTHLYRKYDLLLTFRASDYKFIYYINSNILMSVVSMKAFSPCSSYCSMLGRNAYIEFGNVSRLCCAELLKYSKWRTHWEGLRWNQCVRLQCETRQSTNVVWRSEIDSIAAFLTPVVTANGRTLDESTT